MRWTAASKPLIELIVRTECGDETADALGPMKKKDAAAEAERLLEGRGWLPEQLRGTAAEAGSALEHMLVAAE